MNAKNSDLKRIQEIIDTITQTQIEIIDVKMTKHVFLSPSTSAEGLMAEGLENRVFRIAEEGSQLSEDAEQYGFDRRAMRGLRNVLAHAYGEVDRLIVWNVIEIEFPKLLEACQLYRANH